MLSILCHGTVLDQFSRVQIAQSTDRHRYIPNLPSKMDGDGDALHECAATVTVRDLGRARGAKKLDNRSGKFADFRHRTSVRVIAQDTDAWMVRRRNVE